MDIGLAVTDDMRRHKIPDETAFFVWMLKGERFHPFARLVFLTTSAVHDQEYESSRSHHPHKSNPSSKIGGFIFIYWGANFLL